ncbi:hypothetical protein BPOR_0026g00270 [Botrytis porri]|uniref:Ketoreductase (KR) domain-containing protein n=1 Tax=Botrytis porri TaxID=87229 RepID=A0A4Z1L4L5_9HELO|nr:hypothetical protein BPOR_0026g00270 [Botrytis porri]
MGVTFLQFFPPAPTLTEQNVPRQTGKVFIITGGTSGVGLELATILYKAGGKFYTAGRSETNAQKCIEKIKSSFTSKSPGQLGFIKASAESFMKERDKARRLLK